MTDRKAKSALLTTLAGVRGAITLAAAFSIPLALEDGSPFPQRSLILFICVEVIVLTLLGANAILPLLARESAEERGEDAGERMRRARLRMLEAGLATVREEMSQGADRARGIDLIGSYNRRIQMAKLGDRSGMSASWKEAVRLRLAGLQAEREMAKRWLAEGRLSPQIEAIWQWRIRRGELAMTSRFKFVLSLGRLSILRLLKGKTGKDRKRHARAEQWDDWKALRLESVRAAVERIRSLRTNDNEAIVRAIVDDYEDLAMRLESDRYWESPGRPRGERSGDTELELRALQAERNEIQRLYERGEVDRETAAELRMDVNYRESRLFERDESSLTTAHSG